MYGVFILCCFHHDILKIIKRLGLTNIYLNFLLLTIKKRRKEVIEEITY